MNHAVDPGFVADMPPPRRSAAQAPLDLWVRAVLLLLLVGALLAAMAAFLKTPMPTAVDSRLFAREFAGLDRQLAAIRRSGARPLSIVFLGTSRIRNVALDNAGIAAAARGAGIARPVASAAIGVNWGGFERFSPALPMITARRPDLVVIMPELLEEDFSPLTRVRMGKGWLQAALWGQDFSPFAQDETRFQVCAGFDTPIADREAEFRSFVVPDPQGRGPRAAREFIRKLVASGTRVIVADVPVSPEMAAARAPLPSEGDYARRLGLAGQPNIAVRLIGSSFPRSAYCDYAHIAPKSAGFWQRAIMARVAADFAAGH